MGDAEGATKPSSQSQRKGTAGEESSNLPALVAVLGLIAPLAAALGALALTGTVGRIQRNAEARTELAFILVVAASAVWGIGLILGSKWLRVLAVATAAAGTVFALLAAITTAHRQSRPQIRATLNDTHTVITATVTASGLAIGDRLAIEVDGLVWRSRNEVPAPTKPSLYQAYIGPDQDGHISQTVSVAVPQEYNAVGVKAYTGKQSPHCNDFGEAVASRESGTGCVIMSLAKP